MSIFHHDKEKQIQSNAPVRQKITEEDLKLKAFQIGKTSPANCECPPAPDIIPIWIDNNIEIFEFYIHNLYSEFDIPKESLPKILFSMFDGFKELIKANPDEGDLGGFSRQKDIEISKTIFIRIAEKHGMTLNFPSNAA